MATNDPSNTTDTHQRLSSTVPNDYNHLGVPGSLDMSLAESKRGRARRRAQARHRRRLPNWLKALLAIGVGTAAFGVVCLVIFLILFPPYFREKLEPRYQQRIIDYFPLATYWMPTRPFDQIPTLGGAEDSDAAQQLLMTQDSGPVETPDPNAGGGGLDEGGATPVDSATPLPTPTGGGIPVGMEPTGTPQPTPLPTYAAPTQALLPTFTPLVAPTQVPLPPQVKLDNVKYELQGWNNCGPTTMTMALSYYGWGDGQTTAATWMKPDQEDKNVSPWQMVRFVNEVAQSRLGVRALYRYGGTMLLLKQLLAAGFPVVVEKSIQPEGDDWMGHYVLLVGYNDAQQHFLTFDSYLGYGQGQGLPSPYSTFDDRWRHFNRVFMVLYRPDEELRLRDALGDYVDPQVAFTMALETARAEAAKHQDDPFAWFNMGTNYVALGEYENAALAYDQAVRLGLPWRMLWYQFGPYEAFYNVGDYPAVLALANNTLATTKYIEEAYYWQGMAYAARGDRSQAIERLNTALTYNRNYFPAQEAKDQIEAGTFQPPAVARAS